MNDAKLDIFRSQLAELTGGRRSGKSMMAYLLAVAVVETLGLPIALDYGCVDDVDSFLDKIDSMAKSRDWAKWFWKEVQRIPPLLIAPPRRYVRSVPTIVVPTIVLRTPARLRSPLLETMYVDETMHVPKGEWEKHILPLGDKS